MWALSTSEPEAVRNLLVRPPFAENPPIKLRFEAPSLGLVVAAGSFLGLIPEAVSLGQSVSFVFPSMSDVST